MGQFLTHLRESAISSRLRDVNKIKNTVDRALAKYTLDPVYRYEIDDIIHAGVTRYPNVDSMTIYRGLNFSTQQEYEHFKASIQDGTLTTPTTTSWSPSETQASVFARTKPSFMEFMSAANWTEISNQSKSKERITGYRGVILTTTIAPNTALDVSKSDHSVESEILLPPGTYPVTVTELKTFRDTVADSDVNTILQSLDTDTDADARTFLDYLLHHHGSELNDASKRKVFKLLHIRPFRYSIKSTEANKIFHTQASLDMHISRIDVFATLKPYILATDYQKLLTQSRAPFKQMLKDIEQQYEPGQVINWNHASAGTIADLLGLRSEYIATMKRTIGAEYQRTTSREHNKNVTDIDKEAERIQALLRSIS